MYSQLEREVGCSCLGGNLHRKHQRMDGCKQDKLFALKPLGQVEVIVSFFKCALWMLTSIQNDSFKRPLLWLISICLCVRKFVPRLIYIYIYIYIYISCWVIFCLASKCCSSSQFVCNTPMKEELRPSETVDLCTILRK